MTTAHRRDGQDLLDVIKKTFRPLQRWTVLTVRRDWPDGTHDFKGRFRTEDEARVWISEDLIRLIGADEEPRHNPVLVPLREYRHHQRVRRCSDSSCPRAPHPWRLRGDEFTAEDSTQ